MSKTYRFKFPKQTAKRHSPAPFDSGNSAEEWWWEKIEEEATARGLPLPIKAGMPPPNAPYEMTKYQEGSPKDGSFNHRFFEIKWRSRKAWPEEHIWTAKGYQAVPIAFQEEFEMSDPQFKNLDHVKLIYQVGNEWAVYCGFPREK